MMPNRRENGTARLEQKEQECLRKALEFRRRAFEGNDRWTDIVYELFHSRDKDDAFKYIVAWDVKCSWATNTKNAIEELYALLAREGQNTLKFLSEHKVEWTVAKDVEDKAQRIADICRSLDELQRGIESANFVGLLKSVADTFEAGGVFTHANEASTLYRCMAQIADHPLWLIEFPVMPRDSLPYFRSLASILQENFVLPLPVWLGLGQWNPLRKIERSEQQGHIPPNRLDLSIIRKLYEQRKGAAERKQTIWKTLDSEQRKYQGTQGLVLSLAPDISFSSEEYEVETDLPFLIENRGDDLVWKLQFHIESAPHEEYEIQGNNRFEYNRLYPKEYATPITRLRVSKSTQVRVVLKYDCPFGGNIELLREYRVLKGDERLQGKRLLNPYIPERPLRYAREIKNFGDLLSRRQILEQIVSTLLDRKGEGVWINLYGLRRIGKTSLLYQLQNELPNLHKVHRDIGKLRLVPVYINCLDLDANKDWNKKGVCHFIARNVRYVLQERLKELPIFLIESTEEPKQIFRKFLKDIYKQAPNIRLVIMLDDAHVLNDSPFKSFAPQLLFDLQDLASMKGTGFCLILVTEREIDKIWPQFTKPSESKPGGLEERLLSVNKRFLLPSMSEEEVKSVAKKAQLDYSDLALEYLWRVTGGYPSLVQAICYHLVEDRRAKGKRAVTMPVVRETIDSFIRNKDTYKYLEYLGKGFTPSEWKLLADIVWGYYGKKLDASTMRIEVDTLTDSEREDLFSLATKGVIEEAPFGEQGQIGWRRLRVGFFKLWIEANQIGREEEKGVVPTRGTSGV